MHQIPTLKYKYGDLEPWLDEQTMRIHHTKHHQAYVDKLNAALEAYPDLAQKSVEELLRDLEAVPEQIRTAVRNHGGGHYNHTLWWEFLAPASEKQTPHEKTITVLDENFGGLETFQKQFKEAALGRFGAGWAWLVLNEGGKPEIVTTPNQDSPISNSQLPILGLDVWEHAYYLKYQNRRNEYFDAWWQVINWSRVEALLLQK